jgi:hypothetical protein
MYLFEKKFCAIFVRGICGGSLMSVLENGSLMSVYGQGGKTNRAEHPSEIIGKKW